MRGVEGKKGEGEGEMGREREGRSAGLCSEGIQRTWMGEDRVERRREMERRIWARCGAWAPDLRVRAA